MKYIMLIYQGAALVTFPSRVRGYLVGWRRLVVPARMGSVANRRRGAR